MKNMQNKLRDNPFISSSVITIGFIYDLVDFSVLLTLDTIYLLHFF